MDNLSAAAGVLAGHIRQQPVAAVLLSLVAVAVTTRLWSAYRSSHAGDRAGAPAKGHARPVPAVPYWLPVLGHIPQMALGAAGFLAGLRRRYPRGIFALNLGGRSHALVFRPELGAAVLNKPDAVANGHATTTRLLRTNFGWPSTGPAADARLSAAVAEMLTLYPKTLMTEPVLTKMMACTVGAVRHSAADLVTYNQSPVDQSPWERAAAAEVVEGRAGSPVVEADLFELVRNFVVLNANASLVGTDFVANFPDFWDDLWAFDDGFFTLGFTGWLANLLPSGRRALAARGRLMASICEWERAMDASFGEHRDPGPAWRDLDNVSETVSARIDLYRRLGLSVEERASCEFGLIWGMSANASPLVFWIVLRLFADADGGGHLLRRVRDEIAPHVAVAPPLGGFGPGVAEAPVLERLDVEALMERCPLLKAAYIESLRVHVSAWTLKVAHQDFDISERGEEKYRIPKGSYVHVAHELHHTDPARWDEPEAWRPERHIRPGEDGKPVADMGTIRAYGGGVTMCKGRAFAAREILLFTAVIIALWDVEPAGGGPWKIPKHGKAAGTLKPIPPPRVWVRRREVPARS